MKSFYLLCVTLALLISREGTHAQYSSKRVETSPCDIYLAPSLVGGWGVFAARDFLNGETVEVSPRYLPIKSELLRPNVIDDYHYGFTFQRNPEDTSFGAVIFGMAMFYNHGPADKRNVIYTSFGMEPNKDMPWGSMAIGFVANRDISRGEELFSSYGETDQWFTDRGLVMTKKKPEEEVLPSVEQMEQRENQYCSSLVAGVGQSTWVHRVVPTNIPLPYIQKNDMLPLQDHPTAVAKRFVEAGKIMEMAPALVVPISQMEVTPLAPMTITWHDLDEEQQETIKQLREVGAYRMKGFSEETGLMTLDTLKFYEESAILPAAGNIGLVRKVGREEGSDSNCRIEIAAAAQSQENADYGSSGLILKLIATQDIQAGEELRLNLPDRSSWHAKMNLAQHLALTGQPIPAHVIDIRNPHVVPDPVLDGPEQEL